MPTKKLILIGGAPGSGKTFIGKEIASRVGVFVDKDTLSRPFTEALLSAMGEDKDDRESETYLDFARPLEYYVTLQTAVENIGLGHSVVCTAPFLLEYRDKEWLESTEKEAANLGATLVLIWVTADEETAHRRLINRAATRDNWKLANWDKYMAADPFAIPEGLVDLHVMDNSGEPLNPIAHQIEKLVEEIK